LVYIEVTTHNPI